MRTAGFALVAMILCAGPASAQRAESYPGPSHGGPGVTPPGVSPYGGPSRGPVPMTRPGSAIPYRSQPVPSTRFAPVPEPGQPSSLQSGPSVYRSRGTSPYSPSPGYSSSPGPARVQPDISRREYGGRDIRSKAEDLQRMSPEMKAEDRLKVPLLKSMYRQGNDMLDEGRNSGDESKIKMGMQQINEANERVNRLEREYGPGRSQGSERDGRERSGRANGRQDRR